MLARSAVSMGCDGKNFSSPEALFQKCKSLVNFLKTKKKRWATHDWKPGILHRQLGLGSKIKHLLYRARTMNSGRWRAICASSGKVVCDQ
jgi:hypothetical protein